MSARRSIRNVLILAMLTAASQGHPAEPDMQVLESNVSSIEIGSHVTEMQMHALPAGARVKVLLPSYKTKVFEGPLGRSRSWGGTRGPRN